MTSIPQIFGQQKPQAQVNTRLFTVAENNTAQFSIFITNQSGAYDGYNIALVPFGTTEMSANFLAYNTQLAGNAIVSFSGLYLNGGDSVFVESTYGNCSFMATGVDFPS